MKVTVNEKPEKSAREYPWLGIDFNNDCIVLFSEYRKGIVLYVGRSCYKIGSVSATFIEELFTPFRGEIVLSNS